MKTLCHGTDKLYATTSESFLVVECAECTLIRLYPRPTPEQLRSYYPEDYWFNGGTDTADRLADAWRRLVLRDHVQFVESAIEAAGGQGRILDVGCGGGLLLRELGLPEDRLAGLDYSVDAAAVAWGANGVPAVCGVLTRAPFAQGSFSVVTMFHVLEHLYDPVAYIEAARDLLAPGGRLVIQTPNAGCWQFLLFGENWNGLDIPRHLIDFKESDLRNLLDYCGLEVERVKHFSLRDNPAGMATSMATSLDPMSRRVRGVKETPSRKMFKDLLYLLLVLISIPFSLFEALAHAGSTVMIQARVKDAPES
ncbi:MAG TPA: methyltransferase domain-containing protein [Bryobacteraceae bacterium]|nr:methyltransferase domain-containing protein [Bryobacteraceae bacterium]